MKKTLLTMMFSSFLFISVASHANDNLIAANNINQINRTATMNPTMDRIQLIRQVYQEVNNNLNNYKLIEFENQNQSTEGGYVKLYTHNHELKKVAEVYFGETGKQIYEYYFSNNRLCFIFEQTVNYNAAITHLETEYGQQAFDINKSKIKENRYYFYNGKMIQWLDSDKKQVAPNSPRFIKKQQELLQHSIFN